MAWSSIAWTHEVATGLYRRLRRSRAECAGGGSFEVAGKLDIKGHARELVVPVTITQAGALSTATGGFVLKRLQFKIGEGEWADTTVVADDVTVRFRLAFTGLAAL